MEVVDQLVMDKQNDRQTGFNIMKKTLEISFDMSCCLFYIIFSI